MQENKRNKKGSILKFVIAFIFIIGWAGMGVALALSSLNIEMGGTFNFKAEGVSATITGSVGSTSLETITIDEDTTNFTTPSTWQDIKIGFTETNGSWTSTIQISVKNNAECPLYVNFIDKITATNVNITYNNEKGENVSSLGVIECPAGETKTIEIVQTVADISKDITGNFAMDIILSAENNSSLYSDLVFTPIEGTTNCSVRASETLMSQGLSGLTVTIPEKVLINGNIYTVTEIEDHAFDSSYGISTYEEGESDGDGEDATEKTEGQEGDFKVILPETITKIGGYAFRGCSDLKDITIPSSVTSIGSYAFKGCTSLTSITIPSSVTSIGSAAFSGCSSLTSINVESGNTVYHSDGNCIIETASKTLIQGCKTSVIPSDGSVTSIGDDAFKRCTGLTSITIPSSVTSIGSYAFKGCTSLTSITIPSSVTSIGNSAFKSCSRLTSITIPSSVTRIENFAFNGCTNLATVTIDSNKISSSLTSYDTCGCLAENATTIYIKEGCTAGSYITTNFTQQESSDQEGYVMWVKNS